MTLPRILLMWFAIGGALPAAGEDRETVDLTRIDRSVSKEPQYSKSPSYCLLVFGTKAEMRVWLVLDGKTLYLDRDGDGDLTDDDEVIEDTGRYYPTFAVDTLTSRDGRVYRNLRVSKSADGFRISAAIPDKGMQVVASVQPAKIEFAAAAKEAPIVHFDGPPRIIQYSDNRVISRDPNRGSDRDRALRIMVGTPGLGAGTFAAYHCKMCNQHGPLSAKFEFHSDSGGSQIELTETLMKIG